MAIAGGEAFITAIDGFRYPLQTYLVFNYFFKNRIAYIKDSVDLSR